MRYALGPNASGDVKHALGPWLTVIRSEGFSAFGHSFANYNPPYLYLLYLGSLTALNAAGAAAMAFRLRGNVVAAAIVGIAVLLLPEVILNSAMWGQADGIFTALLVWSAWGLLTKRFTLAWVLFALAFSLKLQALFLLPWIALAFLV